MRGGGGQKMFVFVHAHGKKNVHAGGGGSKNGNVVFEWPLRTKQPITSWAARISSKSGLSGSRKLSDTWSTTAFLSCLRSTLVLVSICWKIKNKHGILFPKLFWPTVRKNCSRDREKLLKFEAEGRKFAKILRSLKPKRKHTKRLLAKRGPKYAQEP